MEKQASYTFPVLDGIPVNDCHVHINRWEDGTKNGHENFMGQLEEYRRTFGISRMNIVCIPCHDRLGAAQNLMALLLKLEHPDYSIAAGLDYHSYPVTLPFPEGFRPEEQLADALAVGFDGIKMLEEKPNIRKILGISLADPAFDAYFAMLEQQQVHVLWHVNDPENSWDPAAVNPKHPDWCYASPGHLSYEEIRREVLTVLERHPKLKITFAHLFFHEYHPDRLVQLLETFPNVCVDLTPHTDMYIGMSEDQPRWREIFIRYADRILYGTDYDSSYGRVSHIGHENVYQFLMTDDHFLFWHGREAHGLGLPRDVVKTILHDNYLTRLGETPKPINREAAIQYVRKYLPLVDDAEQKKNIQACCEKHGLL